MLELDNAGAGNIRPPLRQAKTPLKPGHKV